MVAKQLVSFLRSVHLQVFDLMPSYLIPYEKPSDDTNLLFPRFVPSPIILKIGEELQSSCAGASGESCTPPASADTVPCIGETQHILDSCKFLNYENDTRMKSQKIFQTAGTHMRIF